MEPVKKDQQNDGKRIEDEMERAKRGETRISLNQDAPTMNKSEIRSQAIPQKNQAKKRPTIVDVRTTPPVKRDATTGTASTIPVRTVIYIEVGGMEVEQVRQLAKQYAASYEGSVFGPHYVVAVRNGRPSADVEFETEFLETIKQICEVVNGEIKLKDGHTDVQIMRTFVDGGDS